MLRLGRLRCRDDRALGDAAAVVDEQQDGVRILVDHRQVDAPVFVEVAGDEREGPATSRKIDRITEGVVSGSKQDRDAVPTFVRHREIDLAVAVEVIGDERAHGRPHVADGRLSKSTGVAVQDGDLLILLVADDQIDTLVGIHIAGHQERGAANYREVLHARKASSPVAEEDRDTVGHRIGHGEVEMAVVVEVGAHDRGRSDAHRNEKR